MSLRRIQRWTPFRHSAVHFAPALASEPGSARLTRAETPPPAGTLVAPGIPGGNSPATPVFAGIVRDKFPGNPSIGQHNPDALCNHAHRQTPDARHADSYPGASAIPPPAHCVGDPATGSTEDPSSTVPFVSGRGLPSRTQHRLVRILRRAAVDPIALPAAPQITFEPSAEVSAVPTCGSPEAGMIVPAVSPPENAPNEPAHRPRNRPNFMRFGGCSNLQAAVSHADGGAWINQIAVFTSATARTMAIAPTNRCHDTQWIGGKPVSGPAPRPHRPDNRQPTHRADTASLASRGRRSDRNNVGDSHRLRQIRSLRHLPHGPVSTRLGSIDGWPPWIG